MHLHDLLVNGNRHVAPDPGVGPARLTLDGDLMMGVAFPAGHPTQLCLPGASEHLHMSGLEDIGFVAALSPPGPGDDVCITLSYRSGAHEVSREVVVRDGAVCRLLLPSMLDLPDPFAPADLVIRSDGRRSVFVGSSTVTPRQALYRMARGTGVEIGPGPRPQIHDGPDTRVMYIEEMPAAEWVSQYKADVSTEAWNQPGYRIGKAHALPVPDASLDFVFSSHVLEHLYNPIGHFDHWRRKLKPGGVVLGVVPSIEGTKDFVQPPTTLSTLLEEHRTGRFDVPYSSYEAWLRAGQPRHPDPVSAARKLHDDRHSIHVHVYDHAAITALLRHCVQVLGFDAFRLFYKRNAKDFIFAARTAGPSGATA